MKHIITIECENTVSELYIDECDSKNKLAGFTIEGNRLRPFDLIFLKKLNVLRLGQNKENLGTFSSYEVILDKDTGLLHFFKDGKEDLKELFYRNGENATLCDLGYKRYRGKSVERAEKIKLIVKGITIIVTSAALSFLITQIGILSAHELANTPINFKGEWVDVSDSISYIFSFEDKNIFDGEIDAETIKDFIYDSNNINNTAVKDFLWNPELIDKVIDYYKDTPLEVITKFRHKDLNPISFIQEDRVVGKYSLNKDLYVADYDEANFDPSSTPARTLAHEYIHMLQTNSKYYFILEASAEMFAHEFYLDSSNSLDEYSYSTACKYLRILMEIIGPEPIWEVNFKQKSTLLEESIKPYLNEEDFEMFLNIMSTHPYYQEEAFVEYYSKLENILDNMYKSKFGESMYSNPLISAILKNEEYDRAYFSSSLIDSRESYYTISTMSADKAMENGVLSVPVGGHITYEQFMDDEFCPDGEKECDCIVWAILKSNDLYIENNQVKGSITLKDGRTLSADEAITQGIVYPQCSFFYYPKNMDEVRKYMDYTFMFMPAKGYHYDEETQELTLDEPMKIAIPSIKEKFEEKQVKVCF